MVILDRKYILKQFRVNSLLGKTKNRKFGQITHLYLNEKDITKIDDLTILKNITVVYLQNNKISKIENLQFATSLTHLYLQHNKIDRIGNLSSLRKLKKLHLGHNNISVIEGLENLNYLIEFRIENQNLLLGEVLCFEPRSVDTLSKCLESINISGNKITSIKTLSNFDKLQILDARNNLIDDIEELTEIVTSLTQLKDLFLLGNPVTQNYRYRENLIANSDSLLNLDGKTISQVNRVFMKRFQMEKYFRQTKADREVHFSNDITDSLNLPAGLRRSISKAIIQNSAQKFPVTVLSKTRKTEPRFFPPWEPVPALTTLRNNHITPRPFWKNSIKSNKTVDPKATFLPYI